MSSTNNKIIVLDNVFTKEECLSMTSYYDNNISSSQFSKETLNNFIDINLNDSFLSPKIRKVENIARNNYDPNIGIDWGHVVNWPVGASHNLHLDFRKQDTVLSSITYLNDDYTGGETFIKDDLQIIPKVGRTIFFNGQQYVHGVKKILSGSRYSLPLWYKMYDPALNGPKITR